MALLAHTLWRYSQIAQRVPHKGYRWLYGLPSIVPLMRRSEQGKDLGKAQADFREPKHPQLSGGPHVIF